VSDDFGGMPLAAEMNVLQAEVGRDQSFVPARDTQDGTVIPNAGGERTIAGRFQAANAGDELLLS
jgi:hypothetical protein